jgi:hypothetical protein
LVAEDFESVASIGTQLQALQQESAQLPLSEEDYLTLADRHAALLLEVTEQCKVLEKAKDFPAMAALGAQLTALLEVAVSAADNSVKVGASGKAQLGILFYTSPNNAVLCRRCPRRWVHLPGHVRYRDETSGRRAAAPGY